jgi:hypothetical protein
LLLLRRKEGCERERNLKDFAEGRPACGAHRGKPPSVVKGSLKTTVPVHGTRDVHPKTVKSIEKDTGVKLQ